MPRYFFNIRDGKEIADVDGTELSGLDEVRDAAVRFAGEAITELGAQFWNHGDWQLDVTDEQGQQVLTLRFSGGR